MDSRIFFRKNTVKGNRPPFFDLLLARVTDNTESQVVVLVVSVVVVPVVHLAVVVVVVIAAATVIAVVAVVWVDIPAPQVHLKDYPLKYIQLRISGFFSFFNCGG